MDGAEHNFTSKFDLHSENKKPRGITTDGDHLWVVDDQKDGKNRVFKYDIVKNMGGTVTGIAFASVWTLDAANGSPRGITIDPSNNPLSNNAIWVVDAGGTDGSPDAMVYAYADAEQDAGNVLSSVFPLAAGNTKPQGIADPDPDFMPAPRQSAVTAKVESVELQVGSFNLVATPPGWEMPAIGNLSGRSFLSNHDRAFQDLSRPADVLGKATGALDRGQHPALDPTFEASAVDALFSLDDDDFDSSADDELTIGDDANLELDVLVGEFKEYFN
jgi:hypothetical protein